MACPPFHAMLAGSPSLVRHRAHNPAIRWFESSTRYYLYTHAQRIAMTRPGYILSAGGLALLVLVAVDAYGVTLTDDVRDILKMIAWSLGPVLGWFGRDVADPADKAALPADDKESE
jgi:hypothetical protein